MSTRKALQVLVVGVAVAGCAAEPEPTLTPDLPTANDILMGNPTCAEAASLLEADLGDFELRVEPGAPATYPLDDVNWISFESEDQRHLDWTASIGVDAVLVRGGGRTLAHRYQSEARDGVDLTPPINDRTGEPFAITAVVFCYDHELVVTTAASSALTRTHAWTIETVGARARMGLALGKVASLKYRTSVARAGWTDHDRVVRGAIVITNPAPYPARIAAVGASLGELPLKPACLTPMPFELAPFATAVCRYERTLPDATVRTLRVVVDTGSYEVGPGGAMAIVNLDRATIVEEDRRVEVVDDHAGRLGSTSVDHTFTYDLAIGPYTSWLGPTSPCGLTVPFTNTVAAIGVDTGATARDSWTVDVVVLCK